MRLYVKDQCPSCHALQSNPIVQGIPALNIDHDSQAFEELRRAHVGSVPTLIDGSTILSGVREIVSYLQRR